MQSVAEKIGARGAALLEGRQFRSQIYFYYTNRGAHIGLYLAPGGNTPALPLYAVVDSWGKHYMSNICSAAQVGGSLQPLIKHCYQQLDGVPTASAAPSNHPKPLMLKPCVFETLAFSNETWP